MLFVKLYNTLHAFVNLLHMNVAFFLHPAQKLAQLLVTRSLNFKTTALWTDSKRLS